MLNPRKLDNQGFTLIEALLVLSIVIIISSITLLQLRPLHEAKRINQFLDQLQNDIFFSQQFAISHNEPMRIFFDANNSAYLLKRGTSSKIIFQREVDPRIKINLTTLGSTLEFTSSGNIKRAGEIRFLHGDTIYGVTFLIGKGRFYVSEK